MLQQIFSGLQEKVQEFSQYIQKCQTSELNNPAIKNPAFRLFKLIATVLKGAETELLPKNDYADELLESAIQPFIIKNIQDICLYLELFGSFPEFVVVFAVIIKMAARTCGLKLEELYNKIVSLILQIFGLSPQHNYQLLDTFGNFITCFQRSEVQRNWLSENLQNFNTSILTFLSNHRDPDLLTKWIQILTNIYEAYPEYLLNSPEIEQVFDFLLLTFSNSAEYDSLKNISNFLNKLVENKAVVLNEPLLKFVPKITNTIFFKLPDLNNIALVSSIFKLISDLIDHQATLQYSSRFPR